MPLILINWRILHHPYGKKKSGVFLVKKYQTKGERINKVKKEKKRD